MSLMNLVNPPKMSFGSFITCFGADLDMMVTLGEADLEAFRNKESLAGGD